MTYLKLLLTAIFWGGTFIAGKWIAGSVHPLCGAFIRFAIATSLLLAITLREEGRLPVLEKKQLLPVIISGFTGVFAYNILFFTGLKFIDAGRASLIIATNPILISLLSVLFLKEEMNRIKGMGIGISVFGAMLVISGGRLADLTRYEIGLGEMLIFGCVVSWVGYSLVGKVLVRSLSPLASVTYSSVAGTAMLAGPALYAGLGSAIGGYGVADWTSLFYLGFFGTVLGFLWYYEGIQRIGATKASVFINFVPVSAITLSVLVFNEPVTLSLLVGGLLVLLGVYVTNASQRLKQFYSRWFASKKTVKG